MKSPLDCLLPEEILALRRGETSIEDADRAHQHLDTCEDCQALFYELPEPAPAAQGSSVSEPALGAFGARIQQRVNAYMARVQRPSAAAVVVSFQHSAWSGLKLAAHGPGAALPLVAPNAGVRVVDSEVVSVRVVELADDASAPRSSRVLIEVTLPPTSPHELRSASDVTVRDVSGVALSPSEVRVRPLVWTGTFTGSGVFEVTVARLGTVARIDVTRPA